MSLFARFFRRDSSSSSVNNVTTTAAGNKKNEDSDDGKSDGSDDNNETLDLSVEIGGNRGWAAKATVLLYHRVQGVICVGTEGGAVYVYGDGFQYVRTWLTEDPNEVVSLVALHPNKLLVAYADNSLVVLELPTLEVIDLLPSSWLGERDGDLTAIHCDLPSEKNFVFCGTSEGYVYVLDVLETAIRICDYTLSPQDLGFAADNNNKQPLSVSDIQLSPKSDRYLAIGGDGADSSQGMVSVIDLEKHKLVKSFKTSAVASIAWHHAGELLYCGTRNGALYTIHVDKGSCVEAWNAKKEMIDQGDDDDEDDDGSDFTGGRGKAVSIRRLSWLAPQTTAVTDTGCLFALLTTGASDNDNLQNVIVGFSPVHGEMTTIFSLPPIPSVKILSFSLVPTYDRAAKNALSSDENSVDVVPALLMLTQRQDPFDKSSFHRNVQILRCPSSPLSEWSLEIGALPDPRSATEMQPATSEVTCIKGILPKFKNPLSIAKTLLRSVLHDEENVVSTASIQAVSTLQAAAQDVTLTYEDIEEPAKVNRRASQSRRLSTRDFFEKNNNNSDSAVDVSSFGESEPWEMVLTAGEHEEKSEIKIEWRQQDIIFNGHADGTVVAFGVSLPDNRPEMGRGNVWLPLSVLRCGTTSVTCICADESGGLLCVGDEAGVLALYEVYDTQRGVGATDVLRWVREKCAQDAEDAAADLNAPAKSVDDFTDAQYLEELRRYHGDYAFNELRLVFRVNLRESVSSLCLLSAQHTLMVGTTEGSLFACCTATDLKSGALRKVEGVLATGACGSVQSMYYGYNLRTPSSSSASTATTTTTTTAVNADVPVSQLGFAVYALFESGHALVVDAETFVVRSYQVILNKITSSAKTQQAPRTHAVAQMSLLSSTNKVVKQPTLLSFLYAQAREKQLRALDAAIAAAEAAAAASEGSFCAATSAPPVPPPVPVRRGFFFSSAAAGAVNNNTNNTNNNNNSNNTSNPSSSSAMGEKERELRARIIDFASTDVPAKLVFARGLDLVSLSLERFFPASSKRQSESLRSIALNVAGVSSKTVFSRPVVTSVLYTLTEDGESDECFELRDGENYLAALDEEGMLVVLSLRERAVVFSANLLEGVVEDATASLFAGALLPNGSCYMLQRGTMLFSASVRSLEEQRLAFPLPERAIPLCRGVDRALMLLHGREQLLASLKATIKKRRSSVINLTAAPTDLYKIFAKTRDQRAKDELFEGADRDEDSPSTHNAAKGASTKAVRAMDDMQQLQQNFAERGERINRIALKMDDFKQRAQEFKQTAQTQKEMLRQKNARWGLF